MMHAIEIESCGTGIFIYLDLQTAQFQLTRRGNHFTY